MMQAVLLILVDRLEILTLSLLKWPKQKIHQKFQISFRKLLGNKKS